jgi:type VI secretion system protein ImpK
MSAPAINLVNLMSEFYQQVAQIKVWIRNGKLASEVMAILKTDTLPSDTEMAAAISLTLSQWISRKKLDYQDILTAREAMLLDKAFFAMVSLADELLIIDLDWPGKAHWHEVLLEEQLFQTCSAGEMFFDEVEYMLADGDYDAMERELAALQLLALRLGFAGRYRGDEEQLEYYRKKLFHIVNRGQKELEIAISEQAYGQCLMSEQEQRLAPLTNWYRTLTLGFWAYLGAGALLWYWLSVTLEQGGAS